MPSSEQASNKLKAEKSPYLLQHAHNPVNWFPWGDAAFDHARSENKPIFLSIGYSTCHWCHVMARESFADNEVAAILNEHYISIKVDREERPDIDSVYMKICQMMTEHGGWPLTIVMTPDKMPFYAGTYFPKHAKFGLPGLMELLVGLAKKYQEDPEHIADVTGDVLHALEQTKPVKGEKRLEKPAVIHAFHRLKNSFDEAHGGFGGAPKFPQAQNVLFLLHYYYFFHDRQALDMVEKTVRQMAMGGIFDQIGFGFARYATDAAWRIPHFEKMLHDNALLLHVYTACYQVTRDPFYEEIARKIIIFIEREMTSKDGAFYAAIDADSEGVEGKYYVWDYDEVFQVLGEEAGEQFTAAYNMTPYGNFDEKNIPYLTGNLEPDKNLEKARAILLNHREKRVYPHVDDKILTDWNGMMITALARAGMVFQEKKYVDAAKIALSFIEHNLLKEGRLMARYRDGETKFKGFLDDYAYVISGYIMLHKVTYQLEYLKKAKDHMDQTIELFWDQESGGFFQTGVDAEQLLSREKDVFDGALPAGNGVMAHALVKLGSLTGDTMYLEKCEELYHTFYGDLNGYESAGVSLIQSLLLTKNPRKEVVIIGDAADPTRKKLLGELRKSFLPDVTILVAETAEDLAEIAPFAKEYKQLNGQTTVYICENFSCQSPTTDVDAAMKRIVGHLN